MRTIYVLLMKAGVRLLFWWIPATGLAYMLRRYMPELVKPPFLAIAGGYACFMAFYAAPHAIAVNASWLLDLPWRKRRLIVLSALVSASKMALHLIAYAAYLWLGAGVSLPEPHAPSSEPVPVFLIDSIFWCIACCLVFFVLEPGARIANPNQGRDPHLARTGPSARQWRTLTSILVAMTVAGYALREYLFTPFGMTAAISGFFLGVIPISWRRVFMIGRPALRGSLALAIGIWLVATIGQGARAYDFSHHSAGFAASSAHAFLGPWDGELPKEALARLATDDLDYGQVTQAGNRYRARFGAPPPFPDLLRAKTHAGGVHAAVDLYHPAGLTVGDLALLFTKLDAIDAGAEGLPAIIDALGAPLGEQGLIPFLESQSPAANHYALIRARYDRDPKLAGVIAKALPKYRADNVTRALDTIALLSARAVTLRDLASPPQRPPDCTGKLGVVAINYCVRAKANRKDSSLIFEIEKEEWLGPQSPVAQRLLRL